MFYAVYALSCVGSGGGGGSSSLLYWRSVVKVDRYRRIITATYVINIVAGRKNSGRIRHIIIIRAEEQRGLIPLVCVYIDDALLLMNSPGGTYIIHNTYIRTCSHTHTHNTRRRTQHNELQATIKGERAYLRCIFRSAYRYTRKNKNKKDKPNLPTDVKSFGNTRTEPRRL